MRGCTQRLRTGKRAKVAGNLYASFCYLFSSFLFAGLCRIQSRETWTWSTRGRYWPCLLVGKRWSVWGVEYGSMEYGSVECGSVRGCGGVDCEVGV